jgi:hypothetical protein
VIPTPSLSYIPSCFPFNYLDEIRGGGGGGPWPQPVPPSLRLCGSIDLRASIARLVRHMAPAAAGERTLKETATWAVALVCAVFVIISILIEHGIHSLEKVRNVRKLDAANSSSGSWDATLSRKTTTHAKTRQ